MNDDPSAKLNRDASDPRDAVEDLLASLLEQFDEASALGETPRMSAPDELRDRLTPLEECVTLLNQAAREGVLSSLDGDPAKSTDETPATAHDLLLRGELIGQFKIVRELGRGGYGVVFLARDPTIGREVALKLPRPEVLVTANLRRRFIREAQAAGRLDHPHILPVYEAGEDGGLVFLVAPYCRGPTLARWMNESTAPVGPRDAAQLAACLASALEHAHRLGVLHRDIKPGNVLLDPSATTLESVELDLVALPLSAYVPKLTDFGLAKLTETTDHETREGVTLGTPAYMAPEQAAGHVDRIGPATDVYAVGAILYETITGRPPLLGGTDGETLRLIATTEPVAPRQLRAGVPRDLEAICLKCLEKSPTDRYKSAGELNLDLRRFLSGQSTRARPVGASRRVWKWARRRPGIVGLLGLSGFLIAALVGGGWWYAARLAREERVALQHEYSRDMRLAFEARLRGTVDHAEALLARYDQEDPARELRGFEWHWLRKSLHEELLTIPSRHGEAYVVAFSPNGELLFSGGQDGVIRAWDVETTRLAFELRGHSSCVNTLALSPNGRELASGSCDRTVRLWNVDQRREIGVLGEHPDEVHSLCFARREDWLATGSKNNQVRIWDTRSKKPIAVLTDHDDRANVDVVAFREDDRLLAATTAEGCTIWKTDDWSKVASMPVQAFALTFAGNDQHLLFSGKSRELLRWKPPGEDSPTVLAQMPTEIHCIAASPLRQRVFAAGADGSVRELDLLHHTQRLMSGNRSRVQSLAISPNDRFLASASFDGLLRIWNLAAANDQPFATIDCQAEHATLARNRPWIATNSKPDVLQLWNRETGELAGERELDTPVAFSPSGNLLWAVHTPGRYHRLLRVPGLTPVRAFEHWENAQSVSISGDDRIIAILSKDGIARVFDLPDGGERCRATRPSAIPPRTLRVALSHDGSQMVWLESDRLASEAIDTRSGSPVAPPSDLAFLDAACMAPGELGFSPDGLTALSLKDDWGTLAILDIPSGRELHRIRHKHIFTNRWAWAPDGTRLAIATSEHTIAIYDPKSGEELGELDGCLTPILSLEFSPDGKSLTALTSGAEEGFTQWHEWSTGSRRPQDQ